jgi:transcriptional regulator CtsR
MDCDNDLIVCIDNSKYIKNKINKINKINITNENFKKLINNIHDHKKITEENINFINSLPEDKKIEIIIEYDKIVQKLLYDIDDLIKYKNIR